MYLVSKSDIDNNTKKNFKLSLQNKDICDGGMSVSVKPIKTRKQSKDEKSEQSLIRHDNAEEHEDDDDGSNFKQKYRYSQPKKQIPPKQ